MNGDFARRSVLRAFDGVAEKVDEDLSESIGVGEDVCDFEVDQGVSWTEGQRDLLLLAFAANILVSIDSQKRLCDEHLEEGSDFAHLGGYVEWFGIDGEQIHAKARHVENICVKSESACS